MIRQRGGAGCRLCCTGPASPDLAENALLDYLAQNLVAQPKWVERSLASMRATIEEAAHRVPEQLRSDERRLHELETQIDNLVEAIVAGSSASQALQNRLVEAERERDELSEHVKEARALLEAPVQMPGDEWVHQQLADLASILREDERETALLLRKLIKPVMAEAVIAPGTVEYPPPAQPCAGLSFCLDGRYANSFR